MYGDANMPLDFTNPAVIEWQLNTLAVTAAKDKYSAIAADNVALENGGGACGIYRNNATWVQLFSGAAEDKAYASATVAWLRDFGDGLRQRFALRLVPNFSLNGWRWNDPSILLVGNYTDGILSEAGFTQYGSRFLSGTEWENVIAFMMNLQNHGKAYFSINEWPQNLTQAEDVWLLCSYLMGKASAAAVFTSGVQGYGAPVASNLLLTTVDTGTPLSPAPLVDSLTRVYYRNTTTVLAVVNPTAVRARLLLDPLCRYVNIATGQPVPSAGAELGPTSAMLLRCSTKS
jgi:hypothetical protein